jgi:hypothetical protein
MRRAGEYEDVILLGIIVATLLLGGTLVAGLIFCFSEPTGLSFRLAFVVLIVIGGAVAVWCAFFVWYQPRATLRIRGVPLPSQVLQLENGDWVPFEGPLWLANLVIVTSLVAMPLSLPLIVRGVRGIRRRRRDRQPGFPII